MNFHQKLSAYTIGLLTEKDLPDIAMTGLEEGYDSESLRILTGHNSKDNSFVINDYFLRTLKELSLTLQEKKEALIKVVAFYAKSIVDKKTDTYLEFEKLIDIINKTGFHWDDIDLMACFADYISIWEDKTDGLDFHTGEGLTKEKYIEKAEGELRTNLENWLTSNGGA